MRQSNGDSQLTMQHSTSTGVFLTGATGLLGRYLLRNLMLGGESVSVLARSRNDGTSARQRIDDAIRGFEQELGRTLPRPRILEGDLHTPGLGLNAVDRQWLHKHRPSVLHCAASIKFQSSGPDGEPYRSNVDGTQRLLDFCEALKLRQFHYVSTAYVSGNRRELILEDDFDRKQAFRNDYEQSKFTAEQSVRGATFLDRPTIYRPSIIVGDSQTGYSSTFHGFYLPLQLAYVAASAGMVEDVGGYLEALGLQGSERKNLVPVEWVAAALVQILRSPAWHGRTYHLTNSRPVTTYEIGQTIATAIQESASKIPAGNSAAGFAASNLDDFRGQMQVYSAYLSDDPEFDRRNTIQAVGHIQCPRLDRDILLRLARFAITRDFGWPRARPQPFELDVQALWNGFASALQESPSDCLRLEVSGSCGGIWKFALVRSRFMLAGDEQETELNAYLNVHTFSRILRRQSTVAACLSSGGLVFEGQVDCLRRGPALLEALCEQLRKAQWEVCADQTTSCQP
jgi:thioester reductase-like protein